LGQHRNARIADKDGLLEIMAPLPEHGYFTATIQEPPPDLALEIDITSKSLARFLFRRCAAIISARHSRTGFAGFEWFSD
jgi:hypothetical protein